MAAGGKINSVYTKHGSNSGDKIFLATGQQTASALESRITSSSGVAPIFPIAGSDGGTTPLWSEYNFQYYGTSFLIHPDRKYEELPMSGSDGYGIDFGLTKAETCCPIHISTTPVEVTKSGFHIESAAGTQIRFAATKAGPHDLSLLTISGRLVSTQKVNCNIGTNSIEMGVLAQGTYIVRITGVSGIATKFCILGSQ